MRRALPLVLLVVLLASLAHSAVGQDAYSHRYVVKGRILDEAGNPVVGERVELGSRGVPVSGTCDDWAPEARTTDAFGDFHVCLHAHDFPPDAGVSLILAGVEYSAPVDPDLRVTTFLLEARNATGSPRPADWNRTYVVDGKIWQATQPGTVDGVRVRGVPLANESVAIRLDVAGLSFFTNATTDALGDYHVRFHLPVEAREGNLTVSAANATEERPLFTPFMRSRVDVKVEGDGLHPALDEPRAPDVRFPDGGDVDDVNATSREPPGATAPPFVGSAAFWIVAVAAVGALAGAALFARAARRR